MILDLFAGAGGWSEGLRHLGLSDIGIEWDKSACATRAAAGHLTIRADVAQYPTQPFAGRVTGLIASPPCQAWSMAGKRKGERDRLRCHELASDFAEGFDGDPLWGAGSVPDDWEDSRSHLVAQPVRWVRDLRPAWIALEQVPPVLGPWRHFAEIFRGWGYGCWTGILNAADFGVPQTRQRAILVAHRSHPALPPEPTHCRGGSPDGLFAPGLLPWVSMAEALGWGMTERPSFTATSGGTSTGGAEVFGSHAREAMDAARNGGGWKNREHPRESQDEWRQRVLSRPALLGSDEQIAVLEGAVKLHTNRDHRPDGSRQVVDPQASPAPTVTSISGGQWKFSASTKLRNNNQKNATLRDAATEPAGTLYFGNALNDVRWIQDEESFGITVKEASIIQSFRPDHPWQGSKTKKFEQIGNAVPPRLAAHVIGALLGIEVSFEDVAEVMAG